MLIKYNKVNIFSVAIAEGKTKGRLVKLIPGVNTINDDDWNQAKKHPKVKFLLDSKDLEVVTNKNPEKPHEENEGKQTAVELAGMNAGEAKAVVSECFVKETLEQWLDEEERVTVRNQIEKQLKSLELTQEEKDAQQ